MNLRQQIIATLEVAAIVLVSPRNAAPAAVMAGLLTFIAIGSHGRKSN